MRQAGDVAPMSPWGCDWCESMRRFLPRTCARVGAQYFITMEYIDGRDIRRILRHARRACGPPPIHVTVGLLLQLCDALAYAHGRQDESGHPLGLVHRDVSPSNVLVTNTGH